MKLSQTQLIISGTVALAVVVGYLVYKDVSSLFDGSRASEEDESKSD
jgi:hypothetical protein